MRDKAPEKLITVHKAHFANPYVAAERGYIDDVIIPLHEGVARAPSAPLP